MPDPIDDKIPLEQLLVFEDGELIFDGSDPDTYVILEPGATIAEIARQLAAAEERSGAERGPGVPRRRGR